MSKENVELVRRLFDTYSRGDYAAAADCLAPGVVYEVGQEVPAYTDRGRTAFAAGRGVIDRLDRDYAARLGTREYERLKRSLRKLTTADSRGQTP